MSNADKSVIVYLNFFSGRPNPYWKLKENELEELKKKMEDLPKTEKIESPVLGYKGFRIVNKDKIVGIPESIIIFDKTISIKEKNKIIFYEDKNNIEEWLFEQAKEQGHVKVIERVKAYKKERDRARALERKD